MYPEPILITNARIIRPHDIAECAWLLIEQGKIAALSADTPPHIKGAKTVDAAGMMLLPGFIDLHIHGANGFEVMAGDPEALHGMSRFLARGGTTSFLATTWTDDGARISRALEAVAVALDSPAEGATLLGAHLEGPYLNTAKCGAQHDAYIRPADPSEALPWLDLDVIRLLSIAPEFERNHWLIKDAVGRGITVSVAHSDATFEQIESAYALGLSHATHAFNAMSPLHHREPGVVGAVLTLDGITCELICDLKHVHPAAVEILWRCKGADKLVLITDSVRIAGMPDGKYRFSHQEVEKKDGTVRLCSDGTLAGTTLAMNVALRNLMSVTGQGINDLWKTASLNAAKTIGINDRKGTIEIGKDADLVLTDDQLNVQMTIAQGRIVYSRETDQ